MAPEELKASTQADFDDFYKQTTNVYCMLGRDIVLQLPRGSKFGDFTNYPDLRWSKAQQTAWRTTGQAPIRLRSLPPQDTVVTSTLHASIAQTPEGMPKVSPADYRRLQETPKATLSVWRMGTQWSLMIPKAVIQFTDAQKQAFEDGTTKEDGSNAPDVESCFRPQFMNGGVAGAEYEIIQVAISDILEEEKKNRITAKNPQEYYVQMMDQRCENRRGLFVLLPDNNLAGDLVFTADYPWTDDEVKAWKDNKTPPATADTLPSDAKVMIHLLHFPLAQTSEQVRVSPKDFKKLDRATRPCVSNWIINENEALIMWTTDIKFTEQQKADFREGKINEDLSNAPLLVDCMKK